MDIDGYRALLETTGYPVFFGAADAPVGYPIICLTFEGSKDRHADNAKSKKRRYITAEVYMDYRDPEVIETVEHLLDDAGIPYRYDESFIEEESTYMVAYTATLIF